MSSDVTIENQRKLCLLHLYKNTKPFDKLFSSVPNFPIISKSFEKLEYEQLGNDDGQAHSSSSKPFHDQIDSTKFSINILQDLRWLMLWNLWIDTTKLIIISFIMKNQSKKSNAAAKANKDNRKHSHNHHQQQQQSNNEEINGVDDDDEDEQQLLQQNKFDRWARFTKYLTTFNDEDQLNASTNNNNINLIKNIDKLYSLLNIWELTHRRSVTLLSFIQITTCEHKTKLNKLQMNEFLQLELIQAKFLHQITRMNSIIEGYYVQLASWIEIYENLYRVDGEHDPLICSCLSKIYKYQQCRQQRTEDNSKSNLMSDLSESKASIIARDEAHYASSQELAKSNQIYDFHEQLFVGRTVSTMANHHHSKFFKRFQHNSRSRSRNRANGNHHVHNINALDGLQLKYKQMIELGIEWCLGWIGFTNSILHVLTSTNFAGNKSKNMYVSENDDILSSYLSTRPITIWKQTNQLVQLHNAILKLGSSSSPSSTSTTTSTSALEHYKRNLNLFIQFIKLMEMTQAELIVWSQHVYQYLVKNATHLTNSTNELLFNQLREIQLMMDSKEQILAESLQYLYKEIVFFIHYLQTQLESAKPLIPIIVFKNPKATTTTSTTAAQEREEANYNDETKEFSSLLSLLHQKYNHYIRQVDNYNLSSIIEESESSDDQNIPESSKNDESPSSRSFPLVRSQSLEMMISRKSKMILLQEQQSSTNHMTNKLDMSNSESKEDYWSLDLLNNLEYMLETLNQEDSVSFDVLKRKKSAVSSSSSPSPSNTSFSIWLRRTGHFFSSFPRHIRRRCRFSRSVPILRKKTKSKLSISGFCLT